MSSTHGPDTSCSRTVPVQAHNRSPLARERSPVAVGAPFARGALRGPFELVARDAAGEALPTQAHTLATWDDGSVKFALVQFPATVPADATACYTVEPGSPPRPETVCRVIEDDDAFHLDTGPMRVTIRRGATAGLDRVVVDGREVLGDAVSCRFFMLERLERFGHLLEEVEEIEVEERGPLRCLVRLRGKLTPPEGKPPHYGFELTLSACAGERSVRARYTFIALHTQNIYPVERLGLRLRLRGDEPRATFRIDGSGGPHEGSFGAWVPEMIHVFRGADGDRYFWSDGKSPLQSADSLPGRFSLDAGAGRVGVAIRDFEFNGPGGYRVGWDKSHAEAEVRFYDGAQHTLRLGKGRARTHDVLWAFDAEDGDPEALHDRMAAFQAPLVPAVDPVHVCATGAFGELLPASAGAFPEYHRNVREAFDAWQREADLDPRNRGILNFGDFVSVAAYGAPEGIFMDEEYDPAHGLYLLFAQTGDPEYFVAAERLVGHLVDVDIDNVTGHMAFHGYPPLCERHEERVLTGIPELGHIFLDGPMDHYLLTGDRRAMSVARRTAVISGEAAGDPEDGELGPRYMIKSCSRTLGWPLIALARAYEVTGDGECLAVIGRIVNYLDRFTRDPWKEYAEGGKWWRTLMHDGCKPFMVGLVLEGMCGFHRVSGDELTLDVARRITDWLIANMWNESLARFEYEHNAYNGYHRGFQADELMAMPLAYLYERTRNPTYLYVLRRLVGPGARNFTALHGKEFGMVTRSTPRLLAILERTAEDAAPEPEGLRDFVRRRKAPLPPETPAETVLHAPLDGDFDARGNGGAVKGRVRGEPRPVAGPGGRRATFFGFRGGAQRDGHDLGLPDHVAYAVPKDTLRQWGAAGIWVRHDKDMGEQGGVDARPLIYVRGREPKRDTLQLCFIYNELRARLYDSNRWLCGAAETPLAHLEIGAWHHYAVAWQPDGLSVYVNGERRAADEEMVLPDGEQTDLFVGWCDGNWHGAMDYADLRLLRGVVTQEQLARMARGE